MRGIFIKSVFERDEMLECVPNFSEGRDREKIDQIVSSIKSCRILNIHSDPDHNRTVVTFAGEGKETIEGAYNITKKALELIDINRHSGVHPFIGAVDVIPFIPLKNSSMSEAVLAAHALGKMLWEKLSLPVYYYGEAALNETRKELPNVRRGGPPLEPDQGQGLHPTGGAVAIGARDVLLAFNVNLKSEDLGLAREIAKNVREKNSGLAGVRALGLFLESQKCIQISTNITKCPSSCGTFSALSQAFERIAALAEASGLKVINSEIVGMIPERLIFPGMEEQLLLKNFSEKMILPLDY